MRKTTRLKALIEVPELLVMPGAYDALSAMLIEKAGFQAVQASGFGLAASHLGLPDIGILGFREMLDRTRVLVEAVSIPVMADGDTGFGDAATTWHVVRAFEAAGAAGINLEDQVSPKRCGHFSGKAVIAMDEMIGKLRAAVDARQDKDFVINARTDALQPLGVDEAIRRGNAYAEAGATLIFVDGIETRDEVRRVIRASFGNRAKESLVVDFINETDLDQLGDKAGVIEAFFTFARGQQKREAEDLIKAENLNDEAARRYIAASLKREYASDNGTELHAVLPKMSPLNPQ